jgi:hypothetical protein
MAAEILQVVERKQMPSTVDNFVASSPKNVGNLLWRAGSIVYNDGNGRYLPCVRGIPISDAVWLSGDGPGGEPKYANDNFRGGRYPLQEEYRAGRLGKYDEEGDVLWATAKWFGFHYDLGNREPNACSYGLNRRVDVGELGKFVDLNTDETNVETMGSSDPEGFQTERNMLSLMAPVDPYFIDLKDRGESELVGIENRIRSFEICRKLKYRLDCNYRHIVDVVVNRAELKAVGMAEGAKEGAATAGRMLVRAGLRTASLIRSDMTRWEANSELGEDHAISPLPNKPDVYSPAEREAANDDSRLYIRDVACPPEGVHHQMLEYQ